MAKIKGIYAAGMSILNADLSLNVEKTILHSEKLIEQGCHGIAIFGSTGQAQLIPIAEKIDLLNSINFDWDPEGKIWNQKFKELKAFGDELMTIFPGAYPQAQSFWLSGNITTDFLNGLNTTRRAEK